MSHIKEWNCLLALQRYEQFYKLAASTCHQVRCQEGERGDRPVLRDDAARGSVCPYELYDHGKIRKAEKGGRNKVDEIRKNERINIV